MQTTQQTEKKKSLTIKKKVIVRLNTIGIAKYEKYLDSTDPTEGPVTGTLTSSFLSTN